VIRTPPDFRRLRGRCINHLVTTGRLTFCRRNHHRLTVVMTLATILFTSRTAAEHMAKAVELRRMAAGARYLGVVASLLRLAERFDRAAEERRKAVCER
jgi:hypothetical protein